MRVVPDISADADNNTGMLVGLTQRDIDGVARFHETRFGGTSLSSPLIAGIQAVAQQAKGRPIGFANPQLYARYGTSAYRDIVDTRISLARNDYSNRQDPNSLVIKHLHSTGINGVLAATPGYDNITGLGSPSNAYLSSYHR